MNQRLYRAGSPGRKQGQAKEKKFFCDGFKSSTRCWVFTVGFPVGLVLPPLLGSQTLSNLLRPLHEKMRFYTTQLLAGVLATISVVNAHINIVYPALRGPNISKDQILFCGRWISTMSPLVSVSSGLRFSGGYNNNGTRVPFPLGNAFVLFKTAHPTWTG